jgi:hypothetical protein
MSLPARLECTAKILRQVSTLDRAFFTFYNNGLSANTAIVTMSTSSLSPGLAA